MSKGQQRWQNKIVGHDEVDPNELVANPKNWRIHPEFQQQALQGAIDDVGFIRSVTVSHRSGYVLDGHLRVALALSTDQPTIPVEYVDLTESEENEALATLDPLAALAAADAEQLGELIGEIESCDTAVAEMLGQLYEQEVDGQKKDKEGKEHTCPNCGYSWM